MKYKIKAGATSYTADIFILDGSRTDGSGLGSLAYNTSGLTWKYLREGAASSVSVTLASAAVGTFTSGGFVAVSDGITGKYQVGIPNAALAAGAKRVTMELYGATGMVPLLIEIELDAVDYQDAAGFGLSRIDAAVGSRLAPTTAGRTLDVSATGEAGLDWANVGSPTTTISLSGTTIRTVTQGVPTTGTGSYAVNHSGGTGAGGVAATYDTAGGTSFAAWPTDGLRYTINGTIGVPNLRVVAYEKTQYDAVTGTGLAGETVTKADGRWEDPMMLASGDYYVVADAAAFRDAIVTIRVP